MIDKTDSPQRRKNRRETIFMQNHKSRVESAPGSNLVD
jgi:hypothetical protein